MIEHYFSKLNHWVLVELHFISCVYFYFWVMNSADISNIIIALFADDHELRFWKLLIVWHLMVIHAAISNGEKGLIPSDCDTFTFTFFIIDSFKFQN